MALRLKGGGPLPEVGDRLVVGTCDIAGAGVRALLGLARADGAPPPAVHELELASLVAPLSRDDADARAVFVPPGADGDATPAVSLVRLDERLSLLAVNAAIREEDEAPLAAAVLALAADCGHLLIAGALRVDTDAPLEVELGGESSDETKRETLATKSAAPQPKMRDGVLAALLPAARARGARATGVFVPGHRVACLGSLGDGTPSATEAEATRTTHALGEAVARKLNELDRSDRSADVFENAYRYDAAAAERFRAARLWRENAGAPARADRMYT
jgi:hypothetical protein